MSDNYEATIAELQKEISERMKTVNSLRMLRGLPPVYPDPDSTAASSSGTIRSDQWYTKGLATAVREYLEMRASANQGAASVDEIYRALSQGGFKFETKDEAYAKPALRQSLTKNTTIFHRLPNGNYGLTVWYSLGKNEADGSGDSSGRSHRKQSRITKKKKIGKKSSSQTESSVEKNENDVNGETNVTLLHAVKEAIKSAKGEFTKQDILNSVAQKYPGLSATSRRVSVFTMITHLREELGFETAKAAKGKEPGTYRRTKE